MRGLTPTITLTLSLATAPPAGAELIDSQPGGFVSKNEAIVNASPDRIFKALMSGIGKWWDPEHTYSGDSANLSIDPRPGGCFCERIPDKGWIEHMRVIYVSRPDTLRLRGALGPLQSSGITGSLTWTLVAAGDKTTLQQVYSVGGYQQGGFTELAPVVDSVLTIQFSRLQRYLETGNPAPAVPK